MARDGAPSLFGVSLCWLYVGWFAQRHLGSFTFTSCVEGFIARKGVRVSSVRLAFPKREDQAAYSGPGPENMLRLPDVQC